MLTFIENIYTSKEFTKLFMEKWFMNFVVTPGASTVKRDAQLNIQLPELTDLGWVYCSISNIFEDKLSTADKIILGYLLSKEDISVLLALPEKDRDRRQLLNALEALEDYKTKGTSNVLLPLDMATSALILMSALYRCTKTMEMVGLTSKAKTVEEQLIEPVSDSYTKLYETALSKLDPKDQQDAKTSLTRDELKKLVIMPDYYGSSAAINRIPEIMHEPYLQTKRELIPAHIKHLDWGRKAGSALAAADIVEPTWICSLTGRNIGYTCTGSITADVYIAEEDITFSVSKTVPGNSYHLPLIANTIHSADSSILVAWYKYAQANYISTFTTHDAINCTANNLNQMRQIIAEQIVFISYTNPIMDLSKQLSLPEPQIGNFDNWVTHFKPHNFLT